MTLLIILALLGLVITYAVFFLLFKIIWILLKNPSNKWPLIWAGISTIAFSIAFVAMTAWGVYKVISPFKGMISNLSENPTPIYGERIYTDPIYRFQLDVFNGMDFSDWIEIDDLDVKIGVDMNVFKETTSPEEKEQNEKNFMGVLLLRQDEVDEGHPMEALRKALSSTDNRRDVEILSQEDFMIDGYPAIFATGRLSARNGNQVFTAVTAIADAYQQVFYVISFAPETPEAISYATQTARSFRLENGSSLPMTADPALTQQMNTAVTGTN